MRARWPVHARTGEKVAQVANRSVARSRIVQIIDNQRLPTKSASTFHLQQVPNFKTHHTMLLDFLIGKVELFDQLRNGGHLPSDDWYFCSLLLNSLGNLLLNSLGHLR
jgi:hypothetical protein